MSLTRSCRAPMPLWVRMFGPSARSYCPTGPLPSAASSPVLCPGTAVQPCPETSFLICLSGGCDFHQWSCSFGICPHLLTPMFLRVCLHRDITLHIVFLIPLLFSPQFPISVHGASPPSCSEQKPGGQALSLSLTSLLPKTVQMMVLPCVCLLLLFVSCRSPLAHWSPVSSLNIQCPPAPGPLHMQQAV